MKFLTLEDPKDIKVEKGIADCDWCGEGKDVLRKLIREDRDFTICYDCINQLSELTK